MLGDAGISISSMAVGPSRQPGAGTALMVLSTSEPAPDDVVARLQGDEGILDLHRISL